MNKLNLNVQASTRTIVTNQGMTLLEALVALIMLVVFAVLSYW